MERKMSASQVRGMTKQQLKSWLTSQDQRLPTEDRRKDYYVKRVLDYQEKFMDTESENDEGSPTIARKRRGRRASISTSNSGHNTRVSMIKSKRTTTPSPLKKKKTVVVSTPAEKQKQKRRRYSTASVADTVPTPSPSRGRRVKMVPTSSGKKKTPQHIKDKLQKTRERMRSNSIEPVKLRQNIETKTYPIKKEARLHTVKELKSWLTRHCITFNHGELKRYYVDLVEEHSYLKSPKRALSPKSSVDNASPPKKRRTNTNVPHSYQDNSPVPANLEASPLTPRDVRKRSAREESSEDSPELLPGSETTAGHFVKTPALIKRGVQKVSRQQEMKMRDEIRLMLDDDDDFVFASAVTAGSDNDAPKGVPLSARSRDMISKFTDTFSPERVFSRVAGYFGGSAKKEKHTVARGGFAPGHKNVISPSPLYGVPIRSRVHDQSAVNATTLSVDSPLRAPPRRVQVDEDIPTPMTEDEDEIDTEVEEDEELEVPQMETQEEQEQESEASGGFLSSFLNRGAQPKKHSPPKPSPFPTQRLYFPSSRKSDKGTSVTGASGQRAKRKSPQKASRGRQNQRKDQFVPSKPPAKVLDHVKEYEVQKQHPRVPVQVQPVHKPRQSRARLLSPERPPYAETPPVPPAALSERVRSWKPFVIAGSLVLAFALLVPLLLTPSYNPTKVMSSVMEGVSSIIDGHKWMSDGPLFCDKNRNTIAGRRNSDGNPVACVQCPVHAESCVAGICTCQKGYILEGSECIVDQKVVRLAHEISDQAKVILGQRKGAHLCGQDVEPFMSESELMSKLKISSPMQLNEAFRHFKTRIVPDSVRFQYDAGRNRYESSFAMKSLKCRTTEWVVENIYVVLGVLLFVVLISYFGVSYWFARRNRKQAKELQSVVYHLLEEQEQLNSHVPYLPIDVIRVRLGNPKRSVWQELHTLIATDPNIQKSMRMVDGLQKKCWKLSSTPMISRIRSHTNQAQMNQTKDADALKPNFEFQQAPNKHSIYSPARSFGITPARPQNNFAARPHMQANRRMHPSHNLLATSNKQNVSGLPVSSDKGYNPWG